MTIKPLFELNNGFLQPTVVLCHRNKTPIGVLSFISALSIDVDINQTYETSFKVYKEVDGVLNPYWDDIIDLKLIYLVEYDEYLEIEVKTDETGNVCKSITAKNLVACELGQTMLFDVEINTEIDIERDDYVMAKIYDDDKPETSLLGRVINKTPHYSIKHVDKTLYNLVRVFSINDKSVYDFLTSDLADEIHCLIVPHSNTRQISVYDLYDTCEDCGYRADSLVECPECGSTKIIKGYGEDTNVYISVDNLAESISISTNKDEIKNTFRVQGGDDEVTTAVAAVNPNGTNYIMRFSEEMLNDMSKELREKIESYNALYESYKPEYKELMVELYDAIDKVQYYKSAMSPKVDPVDHTVEEEVAKLTAANLSPIAVQKFSTATESTVNKTVLEYAKIFIDSGFVVEIETTDNYFPDAKVWKGKFKVTVEGYDYNNATSEEQRLNTAISSEIITIVINDDYENFVKQKMEKILADKEINKDIQYDWTKYSLNRLVSFSDAYQSCLDIMIQQNISDPKNTLYELYVKYYNKKLEIDEEIKVREKQVSEAEAKENELINEKNKIQNILNFEKYLGTDLYYEYCAYRREQSYTNDNYISDGLVPDQATTMSTELNTKILEMADELIKTANQELYKASETQYTIQTTMGNLFAMKEFEPLTNDLTGKFIVGNWISLRADDKLFRLRLLSYTVEDSDLTNLSVTFSNVTRIYNGYSDIQSVLSQAQNMATSYGALTNQVNKTANSTDSVVATLSDGLNASLTNVSSDNDQNIVFNDHGLLCRSYESTTDSYELEQLKIVNNCISITNDNWETVKSALGKINYYDPIDKIDKTAYGLIAETIIGDLLIGQKLVISNEDNTVVIDGQGITLDGGAITWIAPMDGNNIEGLKEMLGVTKITSDAVIAPKIQGGYLYINNHDGCSVEINPLRNEDVGNGDVIRVANEYDADIFKIDNYGNAFFNGTITSSEGEIGSITLHDWGLSVVHSYVDEEGEVTAKWTAGFNSDWKQGMVKANTIFWAGGTYDDDEEIESLRISPYGNFQINDDGSYKFKTGYNNGVLYLNEDATIQMSIGTGKYTVVSYDDDDDTITIGDSRKELKLIGTNVNINNQELLTEENAVDVMIASNKFVASDDIQDIVDEAIASTDTFEKKSDLITDIVASNTFEKKSDLISDVIASNTFVKKTELVDTLVEDGTFVTNDDLIDTLKTDGTFAQKTEIVGIVKEDSSIMTDSNVVSTLKTDGTFAQKDEVIDIVKDDDSIITSTNLVSTLKTDGSFVESDNLIQDIKDSNTFVEKASLISDLTTDGTFVTKTELLDIIIPKGEIEIVITKPNTKVYGKSYYEYFVPLPHANKRTITLLEVSIKEYVPITSDCSIASTNQSGVLIRDSNGNGTNYPLKVKFKIQ